MHAFQDPSALLTIGQGGEAFPFLSTASPSDFYLGWVVVWVLVVGGLAALAFRRRDL
jgi:hypothetical protein